MAVALSTILFVDDIPVGYEISRKGDYFLFTPTRFSETACCPPQFSVIKNNDNYYQFAEPITKDMQEQATQALQQLEIGKLLDE